MHEILTLGHSLAKTFVTGGYSKAFKHILWPVNDLQQIFLLLYFTESNLYHSLFVDLVWASPNRSNWPQLYDNKESVVLYEPQKTGDFHLTFLPPLHMKPRWLGGAKGMTSIFQSTFCPTFGKFDPLTYNFEVSILFWKGWLKPRVWPKMQKPENKAASQPFWFLYRITNFSGWTQKTTSLAADCSGFVWEFYLGQTQS